jgi:hypothetical protein
MKMEDNKFKAELQLALSKPLKTVLTDAKGNNYIQEKLKQASFSIEMKEDEMVAVKVDPVRTYMFVFRSDSMTFAMELDASLTNNPQRWFLDTLLGEINVLQHLAREYITDQATPLSQATPVKAQSYVG